MLYFMEAYIVVEDECLLDSCEFGLLTFFKFQQKHIYMYLLRNYCIAYLILFYVSHILGCYMFLSRLKVIFYSRNFWQHVR
jgi:hypothetical protein